MNFVGLESLSDLKLVADGPLRLRAIHLCSNLSMLLIDY